MLERLSLRVKLMLGYALVFVLILLLGGTGIYLATSSILTNSLDTSLREMASIAQGSVERDNDRWRFTPELRPTRDVSIELLNAFGEVLSVSGPQEDHAPHTLSVKVGLSTEDQRRVLTSAIPGGLYLRVSRPTETLSEFLETLARLLLVGGGLMIAAACGAGYWLAHRALRPVDEVARTAQSIAAQGDYAQRVPQAPGQDEMARLTRTVNTMLDRLAGTIEREKQFARIAAHELRTPLTVLKGRLDLTLDRPRTAPEYEKALTGMQGRVDALTTLSESLLALARTDAPVKLERVELASLALKVGESLEENAAQRGKQLQLDLTESWVQAEREGVECVISNLLENALKYGEGPQVTLRVKGRTLSVENGGSGPNPEQWERLLQPFERGPDTQAADGSGLGLALVAALTRRWRASLLPQWQAGGFKISVTFPGESGKGAA